MSGVRRRAVVAGLLALAVACALEPKSPRPPKPQKPSPQTTSYDALGGGHLIRAVSSEGRYVTLEDGSVWEIEPSVWFQTVDWQKDAAVTVRSAQGIGPFVYELINTQEDERAPARYVGPR